MESSGTRSMRLASGSWFCSYKIEIRIQFNLYLNKDSSGFALKEIRHNTR